REGGAVRTLTVCSPTAFAGSLVVRPHVGRGLAAVVLSRARGAVARDLASRPETLWTALSVPLETARAEHEAALTRAGYAARRLVASGPLALGRRASVGVALGAHAGACTRYDVVAGAPLTLVEATIRDEHGTLLSAGDGAFGATLFACAQGKATVELETRG